MDIQPLIMSEDVKKAMQEGRNVRCMWLGGEEKLLAIGENADGYRRARTPLSKGWIEPNLIYFDADEPVSPVQVSLWEGV
jgi:hypothetical protein